MTLARRRYRLLVVYLLMVIPWIGYGAMQAMNSNANSPIDWVPDTFAPRHSYDKFRERFGPGDVVVMSWPGCNVDDSRLDRLTRCLRNDSLFFDSEGTWYFERVVSGRELLRALQSPPIQLDRALAVTRLSGTLIGPDQAITCIAVTFTEEGLRRRAPLVASLQRSVHTICGVAYEDLHFAGPVMDGLSVDQASKRALARFAIPSTLVVFFVCYLCLGSLRGALLVLAISLLGQAATLSLVHFSGDEMSALHIVMPPLIQVLAVAGGIHLINYYSEARASYGGEAAAGRALQLGWLPCILSAGTTAWGLASLTSSQLTPIRSFGAYACLGVLITTGLILTLIPGTLMVFPIPIRSASALFGSKQSTDRAGFWERVVHFLQVGHQPIVLFSLAAMLLMGWGLSRLKPSVRIKTLFAADSRILSDYRWIEQHLGPLVPIETLLKFDSNCQLSLRERLELVWRVEQSLREIPAIGSTTSAMTFVPAFPASPALVDLMTYQSMIDATLEQCRSLFRDLNYLAATDESELLRVTATTSALSDIDYGNIVAECEATVTPLLRDSQGKPIQGVTASYTGIMPLVNAIQQQLLTDLLKSFLAALAVITIVMTLVYGGILPGLVAMVSNVFPILLIFGGIAWLESPMDIGSVMTASVALGIAVDDTLHYLTFFCRGLDQGMSRQESVRFAFEHCGLAMIQTTLICGLGLLVFALSDFVPTSRFAVMMVSMLMLALLADLILLPALLLSPLGIVFIGHGQRKPEIFEQQKPGDAPAVAKVGRSCPSAGLVHSTETPLRNPIRSAPTSAMPRKGDGGHCDVRQAITP